MARIDFEPRWMASRTARGSRSGMVVARGRDDRHRIEIGGRENESPARMTFRPTRHGARHGGRCDTRGDRNGGKNKSTTRGREWCFNGAADWSNYWRNIAIITSLSRRPRTSPVCLRHVLKMITICIYVYRYIRRDCRQNRPSAVPIENHSVECRQSKDREPVETDLSRPARWQRDR